ncbi:MAG: hypothetical protein K6T83_09310 [Alicyclobacillus sp.]|nr:hypothetical protein [Alicyclobacillus sp.]
MIRRFNEWLAERLSIILSSMWLFWVLCVMTWGSILLQRPNGAQGWDLFLVSIFFQAVALPVINLTTAKQGDRMERVLNETHDAVMSELAELRRMHEEQKAEIAELKAIHRELEAKLGRRAHER